MGPALAERYPQMRMADPGAYGILEPRQRSLLARRAVAAVVEDAMRRGVVYAGEAVKLPTERGRAEVRTISGEPIRAGLFMFACGPWLPKVFPELLATRIYPTRQEMFFFAPPPATRDSLHLLFRHGLISPIRADRMDVRTSRAAASSSGFDRHGDAFDPEAETGGSATQGLRDARQFLSERFPDLRDAPLTESRVCQYENTSNGDFLIDRHPEFEQRVGGGRRLGARLQARSGGGRICVPAVTAKAARRKGAIFARDARDGHASAHCVLKGLKAH